MERDGIHKEWMSSIREKSDEKEENGVKISEGFPCDKKSSLEYRCLLDESMDGLTK